MTQHSFLSPSLSLSAFLHFPSLSLWGRGGLSSSCRVRRLSLCSCNKERSGSGTARHDVAGSRIERKALHITSRVCHSLPCSSRTAESTALHVQGVVVSDLNRALWMALCLLARGWCITANVAAVKCKSTFPQLLHVHVKCTHPFTYFHLFVCACLFAIRTRCFLCLCELPGSVFNSCIKGYSQFVSVDQATTTETEWNVNLKKKKKNVKKNALRERSNHWVAGVEWILSAGAADSRGVACPFFC